MVVDAKKEIFIMANCTDAQGTFTFNTDFYNKHEALLEDYFDTDNTIFAEAYGITDLYSEGDGSFKFAATGRWSMESILPWCLMPVDDNQQNIKAYKQYQQIVDFMRKENAKVDFDYTDYDPGMEWYVTQKVVLCADSDPTNDQLVVKSIDNKDLPMDEYSLISANLEDGIDVIDLNDSSEEELTKNIIEPLMPILQKHGIKLTLDQATDKVINYVGHDKQYQGGIIYNHYADQTCLNDWYKNDLNKAFEK